MIARRAFMATGMAFAALPLHAQAARFSVKGAMEQGSLCVGATEPSAQVSIDCKIVRVSSGGIFAFATA